MPWYAIRTVYLFGQKADGTNVFEERVVGFAASDWDEANAKGDVESNAYAEANGFVAHPEQAGYELDGATFAEGAELWSEMSEARLSLEAFYRQRYGAFEFTPDDDGGSVQ